MEIRINLISEQQVSNYSYLTCILVLDNVMNVHLYCIFFFLSLVNVNRNNNLDSNLSSYDSQWKKKLILQEFIPC